MKGKMAFAWSAVLLVAVTAPLGCGLLLGLDKYSPAESDGAGDTGSSNGGSLSPCVPAQSEDPVDDECGVFVASHGGDTAAGTKDRPVATLKVAVERARAIKRPVYACAEDFKEAIVIPPGVTIYGGLACADSWVYVGITQKTIIIPAPGAIPVTLAEGFEQVHLEDIAIKAADAVLPGGSSIAVIADGATADFVRCEISAGNGKDGDDGAPWMGPVEPADPDDPAIRGNGGANACTGGVTDTPGGIAKTNNLCTTAIGGAGGIGRVDSGDSGMDGQPLPVDNSEAWGIGGSGGGAAGCKSGESGLIGVDGAPGSGGIALGTISSSGFVGGSGLNGAPGSAAQGGGGGGGAKGKPGCAGAGGGSGGAGGCGGQGGKGGQAGGASIALISLSATLTFTDVTLKAGAGGKGGSGSDGQDGGVGGTGGKGGLGSGTPAACAGGQGGQGGLGGKGGGGRGGHSLGIAYLGTAPSTVGATIQTGAAGEGGLGADMVSGTGGQPGVKSDTQAFD